MHDPSTQAFVIPYGWRTETFKGGTKWRYYKPLVTIWHEDPEKDGSDDSCGWSRPRLNKIQKDICKNLAGDEARDPWFMALDAKTNPDPVACEALIRGAFRMISLCLKNRGQLRREVTNDEAEEWASLLTHNSIDNFRASLCFKSGWHSNWYRDTEPNTEEEDKWFRERSAYDFLAAITGYILRERRPWYRHPRWHFWHWRFQVHHLQQFKRWAFSRCCKCGKRFTWGYSPTTYSWHGTGPHWFKSEDGVFHGDCDRPTSPNLSQSDPTPMPEGSPIRDSSLDTQNQKG